MRNWPTSFHDFLTEPPLFGSSYSTMQMPRASSIVMVAAHYQAEHSDISPRPESPNEATSRLTNDDPVITSDEAGSASDPLIAEETEQSFLDMLLDFDDDSETIFGKDDQALELPNTEESESSFLKMPPVPDKEKSNSGLPTVPLAIASALDPSTTSRSDSAEQVSLFLHKEDNAIDLTSESDTKASPPPSIPVTENAFPVDVEHTVPEDDCIITGFNILDAKHVIPEIKVEAQDVNDIDDEVCWIKTIPREQPACVAEVQVKSENCVLDADDVAATDASQRPSVQPLVDLTVEANLVDETPSQQENAPTSKFLGETAKPNGKNDDESDVQRFSCAPEGLVSQNSDDQAKALQEPVQEVEHTDIPQTTALEENPGTTLAASDEAQSSIPDCPAQQAPSNGTLPKPTKVLVADEGSHSQKKSKLKSLFEGSVFNSLRSNDAVKSIGPVLKEKGVTLDSALDPSANRSNGQELGCEAGEPQPIDSTSLIDPNLVKISTGATHQSDTDGISNDAPDEHPSLSQDSNDRANQSGLSTDPMTTTGSPNPMTDDSWMHEELVDSDSDIEANLELLKTRNKEKKRNRCLTIEDATEELAAEQRLAQKRRRLNANLSRHSPNTPEAEEGLFFTDEIVPSRKRKQDNPGDPVQGIDRGLSNTGKRQRTGQTSEVVQEGQTLQSTHASSDIAQRPAESNIEFEGSLAASALEQPKKKRGRPHAKDARGAHAAEQVKQREKLIAQEAKRRSRQALKREKAAAKLAAKEKKAAEKAATQPSRPSSAPRKQGKKDSRVHQAPQAPPRRKKAVEAAKGDTDQRKVSADEFLNRLIGNDPIANRLAVGDVGEEPVRGEHRTKDKALKELIGSVTNQCKDQAKDDKKRLLQASKMFGHGKVKAKGGGWLVSGMKSPLRHHQLLGVKFIVDRELGGTKPIGGIIADEMGLGKTLQILAAMVGNQPSPTWKGSKATLIVLPASLIEQWQEEIRTHVQMDVLPKILHYKRSQGLSLDIISGCDVVLTSYTEAMRSYPFPGKTEPKGLVDEEDIGQIIKADAESIGALHLIKWHRVVLDESHAIKNHLSRVSIACQALNAKYRWAMSGTPIQNRLEEFYPYFKFLQADHVTDRSAFKQHYCVENSQECKKRLIALLSVIMIRRTQQDTMFNRPIAETPIPHPHCHRIEFSGEERALYQVVEDRFRRDFNMFFKAGTAQENRSNIMVKLLRLRQCTTHPFLLRETIQKLFDLEDLRNLESRIRKSHETGPIYERITEWMKEKPQSSTPESGPEGVVTGPRSDETRPVFGNSDFGKRIELSRYLGTLDEVDMIGRCICHKCQDIAQDPQITNCQHAFCRSCIQEECDRAAAESQQDGLVCPCCHSRLDDVAPYERLEPRTPTEGTPAQIEAEDTLPGKGPKKKGRASDPWLQMDGEILPSSKAIAVKGLILQGLAEAPNDKFIVYSQFRLMIRVIERLCKEEGWGCVIYDSSLDQKERHEAVKKFETDPEKKIMIAGLKCGGIGLNLMVANRVISVDLWWNSSVEAQAFGRVFRIGQKKETHFHRIGINDTVDDRLLAMQTKKKRLVDGAMERFAPLTIEELANLFGYLGKDEDGLPHIFPESDRPVVQPIEDPPLPLGLEQLRQFEGPGSADMGDDLSEAEFDTTDATRLTVIEDDGRPAGA